MANNTVIGTLELVPTYETISVYSNFSGDDNGNNQARLEYREVGSTTWKLAPVLEGPCPNCGSRLTFPQNSAGTGNWVCAECSAVWPARTMVVDRRDQLAKCSYETDQTYYEANPWKNQWRAVIFWLQPDTRYEVRVTYTDPDGVGGGTEVYVTATIRTHNDNPPSNGTAYYVSTTGSDSNNGLTPETAFATIQHAISAVQAGDIVYLMAGTHQGPGKDNPIATSGLPDNYITFQSYDLNDKAIVTGNRLVVAAAGYIRLKGIVVNASGAWGMQPVVLWQGTHDVIVEDMELNLDGSSDWNMCGPTAAIILENIYNILIQRNRIKSPDIGDTDIFGIYSSTYVNYGIVIRENTIVGKAMKDGLSGHWYKDTFVYNNLIQGPYDDLIELEGEGMCVAAWLNTCIGGPSTNMCLGTAPVIVGPYYIFRNIFTGATDSVIKMGNSSEGWTFFFHNTIYTPIWTNGISMFGNNALVNNLVMRNNIIHVARTVIYGSWEEEGWSKCDLDYDLMYTTASGRFVRWDGPEYYDIAEFRAATGYEMHGIEAPSQMVDPDKGDFRLGSTSPCIDAGIILPGFNDVNSPWRYKGSAPDLGAIEAELDTVPPVADFSFEPETGPAPLTVNFTELAFGSIDTWSWSFGDGTTASTPDAVHTYQSEGQYTVRLTVTGPGGFDYIEKVVNVISVSTYVLTINSTAGGTTNPEPGIPHVYAENDEVQISALPDSDFEFVEWQENADFFSDRPVIKVTMNRDYKLTAIFQASIPPPNYWNVTISLIGQGDTIPAPGTYPWEEGKEITVEARPAEGWKFDHWQGDVSGTDKLKTFTVTSNMSVVAVFVEKPPAPGFPLALWAVLPLFPWEGPPLPRFTGWTWDKLGESA